MFPRPPSGKAVFTIDPDVPFLDTVADTLWRQVEGDGFRLSQYVILLPTRRACRHLGAAFTKIAAGKPVLLPRMRPLGDIDEDEISFADDAGFDLPPAIAPLKRLMLLTRQVRRRDTELSWDQAARAAEALARFLDQIQIEQCDISKLPTLVDEQELAAHWQQTIVFLEIVTRNWPLILAEQNCLDPAERRNAVMAAQAALWRRQPPTFPVIAVGSTGSVPATATLLDVIASMPTGAVILPGLDRHIDNAAWDDVEETHPQHSTKRLLAKMGIRREDVTSLPAPTLPSPRFALLSEAMRPAKSTEAWRGLNGKVDLSAIAGLTRLTLDHPQEEAQVIALRLRALLEMPDKTAAFITADRALAVRVAALLRRWGIEVDDSGGTPLASSPVGAFLNLTLAAAAPHAGTVDRLALLKHPFAACGLDIAACRAWARMAEMRVRQESVEDFSLLTNLLGPLTKQWGEALPLADRIAAHIAVAENIATELWRGESGEDTSSWLQEWQRSADGFPALDGSDYAALFDTLSAAKTLRSRRAAHPRLSILGPLEARLISADLIIMGGMNEGMWPPDAGFDPWMSHSMRRKFNLPVPEFRIGLSAHDFVHLACSKEVMMTRSLRSGGAPTVPSRFLLQIDTVLRAAGLSSDTHDALAPPDPWRAWAQALDKPQQITPCAPPQPRPPVSARPKTLSVTDIGTWIRNPYALYARHILKLEKLDELDTDMDASDRGIMIHEALEKFIRVFPAELPQDAEAQLLQIGQSIFAEDRGNPRIRAFWWARFVEIAAWFVATERGRSAQGIRPLMAEGKGIAAIGGLTLKGRADRIDRLANGKLSIIDYKTGAVPSRSDVETGIEPQLPLIALIAAAGGFADIPQSPHASLEYWPLKGGSAKVKITAFTDDTIDMLMTKAKQGLQNLVATYADPAMPYRAVPAPGLQPRINDYAHLSRLAEWGRTEKET